MFKKQDKSEHVNYRDVFHLCKLHSYLAPRSMPAYP